MTNKLAFQAGDIIETNNGRVRKYRVHTPTEINGRTLWWVTPLCCGGGGVLMLLGTTCKPSLSKQNEPSNAPGLF